MSFFRLNGLKLSLDESEECLVQKAAAALNISKGDIVSLAVLRKALDARRNRPPHFVYAVKIDLTEQTVLAESLPEGIQLQAYQDEPMPETSSTETKDVSSDQERLARPAVQKHPVVVVGSGPAGLFAAYTLALKRVPVILLERGRPVEKRIRDVELFWEKGILNPQSNVLFGEGGAGTFSDGKLTSRSKNPYGTWIKKVFVEMGAPVSIMTDAKPHIGTDRLRAVLIQLRHKLLETGCSIRYEAQMTDLMIKDGGVTGVVINHQEEINAEMVILAIGQSADDTYLKLHERGVKMEGKPFAMGLRVEHPQALINEIQYGRWSANPNLPPAEYFVTASVRESDRSVYTFCMCPGGHVIGCSAFPGFVITNGMSNRKRDGAFANSAIVVNVRVDDFMHREWPLCGLEFRKNCEQKAFLAGGGNYFAPVQKVPDFIAGKKSNVLGQTTFLPGIKSVDLAEVLPDFVTCALRAGLKQIDHKMPGFASVDAHLIGVETRTSSPVRICRGSDGQSESIKGLYPCGEGAGYAGGIVSSALDGILAAQKIIEATGGHQ